MGDDASALCPMAFVNGKHIGGYNAIKIFVAALKATAGGYSAQAKARAKLVGPVAVDEGLLGEAPAAPGDAGVARAGACGAEVGASGAEVLATPGGTGVAQAGACDAKVGASRAEIGATSTPRSRPQAQPIEKMA